MSQELSEVFYTFLITSVIAFILGLGKLCYKSKCSEINFCCFRVVRNVEIELREDIESNSQPKDDESSKNKV
jgi:hypothetical protein